MQTFESLNLIFELNSNCDSCRDGFCHSCAVYKSTGAEIHVSIFKNPTNSDIQITASFEPGGQLKPDFEEYFDNETDAVAYLNENFSIIHCV